ncbi:Protein of unknown function [Bacillus wiedmannii]|uniref:Uncharacterized protein n=1 Tax=Bacillus wiedmannii TaxID=1890302 RepID=A0A1C4ERH9_9BACI|nr:Protein of unknown function [Bacillus wiedmannii]
MKLSENIRIK